MQLHIIHAVGLVGYQEFEQAKVEGFIRLLNDLQVCTKDLDNEFGWARLLLDIIKTSKGIQHLPYSYWELLAELAAYLSDELGADIYSPQIIMSLQNAKEWDKLRCWVSAVWLVWPPKGGQTTEGDLKHVMLSLSHQQPGVIQKLEEQMEQWSSMLKTGARGAEHFSASIICLCLF